LIVGCGCRGRALAARLAKDGWSLRGTTRDPARVAEIEAAGIEAAVADPDSSGTLLDLVGDVTVMHWLLGSARAEPEVITAIHGSRLERLLEKLVDSPVRGFVYEAAGDVQRVHLERGAEIVGSAAETWRIPVEVVETDPADRDAWLEAMSAATQRLVD
jgi:glycine/D-amino acid oxidase-like deaminating enzyme